MFRDITIGQYYPSDSCIHRLDPRTKIILTVIYIAVIFMIKNIIGFLILAILGCILIRVSKIPFKLFFKGLKPILFIMLFTGILNLFLTQGGKILWEFYFLKITQKGLNLCIFMVVRIVLLVSGSSFLMYSTSPVDITSALERLLKPLKKIGVPYHEIAMMMSIALRFIPTLIEETDKIICAQKSRGANIDEGNIVKRAKSLIPILVPLFVSSFRRADELATAMESRCYSSNENRTKMKELIYSKKDLYAFIIFFLCAVSVIATGYIF